MSKLFPTYYVTNTYEIDYETMYAAGYRGIIFDIDNTLVNHNAPMDERALELIAKLKAIGFKCAVVSNNDEERVSSFAKPAELYYVYKAAKPAGKGYRAAADVMELDKETTFCVGDQIFTDVWGANRAGLVNFLVKPLGKDIEIQIILKRLLEKIVLAFFFIHHKFGVDYSLIEKVEKKSN